MVQWHEVHSQGCATITTNYLHPEFILENGNERQIKYLLIFLFTPSPHLLSVSRNLTSLGTSEITGIIPYLSFCDCFISLSTVSARFIWTFFFFKPLAFYSFSSFKKIAIKTWAKIDRSTSDRSFIKILQRPTKKYAQFIDKRGH